ncbi:MAG TPA: oligosaccharide flippase family protein [Acidisarcina sp.]
MSIVSQRSSAAAHVALYKERLRRNSFLRKVGVLSGGSALGHLFTLGAAPILARIYGPGNFGRLGLFMSFLSVAGVAVALGFESSIVCGRDEGEAAYLTLASLVLAVPMSLLAGAVLWLLIHYSLLGFGGLPRYTPWLVLVALGCVGVFSALRYWCVREDRFGSISRGLIVQSAARALFQTALGLAGWHSVGLVIGETAGRGMGMSQMLRSAWPVLRRRLAEFDRHELMRALWRNRKFPLFSMPSSFLDALCIGLPVPLLVRLYGNAAGGFYSLVWRAVAVPSVLVTVAIADTFHSRLATCARETPDEVMGLFRRTSLSLLAVGGIPAVLLAAYSQPLFSAVFGPRWALSGAMAGMIAPWYLSQFVVAPVSRVVLVLSGQEMKLVWDIVCICSLITLFVVAQRRGLAMLQTVRMLSFLNTALYVVYFLILVRTVSRFQKMQCPASMASVPDSF